CPDKSLRQPDRSVQLAEQGCRLVGWPDPHRLGILATAYAGAGRFDDAVAVTQEAIQAAGASGNSNQLSQLRGYLHRFENRQSLTER
ncbi:MAG: hypothetical protein HQ582_01665, partial [Planctomycetes bacterium]|nr:hypothetical protein [Planctomycetota bacterium]